MSVLDELVAGAVEDQRSRENNVPLSEVKRMAFEASAPIDARQWLKKADGIPVIAEIKRASPSKGHLSDIPDPAALAREYEQGGASAISVLTEGRRFLGSLEDFDKVRAAVRIPVLRKDFIVTEYQIWEARAHGADLVLLIVAALDDVKLKSLLDLAHSLNMTVLVETHTREEIQRAINAGAKVIGINARNLKDLKVDVNKYNELAADLPDDVIRVAESGVFGSVELEDYARAGADAVLVGEGVATAANHEQAVERLVKAGARVKASEQTPLASHEGPYFGQFGGRYVPEALITALDELAWLLDLRGNDVACTPVFLGFLLLTKEDAVLCARAGAVGEEVKAPLAADGVRLADYEGIYGLVRALPRGTRVLLDGTTANYRLTQSVPDDAETLDRPSPIVPMKAVKNAVEQENLRRAHLADGIALTRFLRWLKCDAVREGATELSAAAKLEEYRRESADYLEPSFDPILAYGPHGAIVHYEATEETDVPLEAHGLLLADTGGHYRTGTTDVTRTVALGPVAEEEKRACTLVLRGHLALAAARFRAGVTGENLDILARGPLWDEGLDYNHGTGHGVGYLLSVHEGPQRIHWSIASNARHTALEPGMIFSDEPGLYLAGKFGVRLENLLLVREAETNAYGCFLSLEPLTLAPFDRDTIDPSLLSDRELAQLNAYHARVYEALAPHLDAETRAWLRGVTAPLGK